MTKMRQNQMLVAVVVLAAAVAGCAEGVNGDVTATQSGGSTVNGSVHVPPGLHSGSVDTVNGSIDIDDNATVSSAKTVNGGITMGAHATADSIATVNGGVTLADGAHVTSAITAVNGGMDLKNGADVGGRVSNVNGRIVLNGAHVAGGLQTVGGDIDITGSSKVEGGILVEKTSGWFNFMNRKPRIVIGPGAAVQGELRFERDVQLYISDKASVGAISGATPIRYAGDNPTG
jgi:DUF4097 and DUF4098 domain-containing protein YvlB